MNRFYALFRDDGSVMFFSCVEMIIVELLPRWRETHLVREVIVDYHPWPTLKDATWPVGTRVEIVPVFFILHDDDRIIAQSSSPDTALWKQLQRDYGFQITTIDIVKKVGSIFPVD